jgi:hypothetical protein
MLKSAFFVLAAVVAAATPLTTSRPTPVSRMATNNICPVCGRNIEPGQGTKVTVRGREYNVDEKVCSDALTAEPDKYLEPDGSPKNERK